MQLVDLLAHYRRERPNVEPQSLNTILFSINNFRRFLNHEPVIFDLTKENLLDQMRRNEEQKLRAANRKSPSRKFAYSLEFRGGKGVFGRSAEDSKTPRTGARSGGLDARGILRALSGDGFARRLLLLLGRKDRADALLEDRAGDRLGHGHACEYDLLGAGERRESENRTLEGPRGNDQGQKTRRNQAASRRHARAYQSIAGRTASAILAGIRSAAKKTLAIPLPLGDSEQKHLKKLAAPGRAAGGPATQISLHPEDGRELCGREQGNRMGGTCCRALSRGRTEALHIGSDLSSASVDRCPATPLLTTALNHPKNLLSATLRSAHRRAHMVPDHVSAWPFSPEKPVIGKRPPTVLFASPAHRPWPLSPLSDAHFFFHTNPLTRKGESKKLRGDVPLVVAAAEEVFPRRDFFRTPASVRSPEVSAPPRPGRLLFYF